MFRTASNLLGFSYEPSEGGTGRFALGGCVVTGLINPVAGFYYWKDK
jgi:hypothetical protein